MTRLLSAFALLLAASLPAAAQDVFTEFNELDAARQQLTQVEDREKRAAKEEELRGMTSAFLEKYSDQASNANARMLIARAHYLNANFHLRVDLAVADRSARLGPAGSGSPRPWS